MGRVTAGTFHRCAGPHLCAVTCYARSRHVMGHMRLLRITVLSDSCSSYFRAWNTSCQALLERCALPRDGDLSLTVCVWVKRRSYEPAAARKKKSKYSATRRLLLKSKLLKKAESLLIKEIEQKKKEREDTLRERVPPLKVSGLSVQELQALCKDLHQKIDIVDEARYDLTVKVARNDMEIQSLTQKIYELKGKMKRPNLKRVKKSADATLGALTDAKLMRADFKANLKTVKKEDDKKEEVTDWRKNVEAMSGMEGRKKLFDAGGQ
ncbi:troponin I4a [Chanos chanos]|uniref:Troponin I4a n=1 Tax=Chanos chanos TaxID=29144 RepID=A0A6J2UQC1_CHACN|nr:troponin I, slow skeletal muscle-like [Chanos chanos]